MSAARTLVLVLAAGFTAAFTAAACSIFEEHADQKGPGSDPGPTMMTPGIDTTGLEGAAIYRMLCASCHGEIGEGITAPALDRWMRPRAELVATIDMRMPLTNPGLCAGACAEKVADFILDALQLPEETCRTIPLPARQLRLLTRREYERTVHDLLHLEKMPCANDSGCNIARESCSAGACELDPCRTHTFSFDPAGRAGISSIVVAGDFNAWASDPANGSWPLIYYPSLGKWYAKHDLADGTHTYKFVINGNEWRPDPSNPDTAYDGFGGENSVLSVSCQNAPPPPPQAPDDPARTFPVETRPQGFAFDDSAPEGIATSVHVTEWMAAAEVLAAVATAHLDRLLPCDPAHDAAGCAETFVRSFGKRAFRRPLLDAEVSKYRALILGEDSFSAGVSVVLQVMLSSPNFLYRSELGEEGTEPGKYRLSAWEIASELSYTFWGTMPDDALFTAAEHGALDTAAGIEAQARRLLADPKSRELIGVFAVEWLGVEPILTANKHASLYPGFDDALRRAMFAETAAFASYVVFDSTHAFEELLTANYGFVDERLAALYGISGVRGGELRRADLPDRKRSGILGQASVLGTYAHSDQSSPIKRGVFVRERLLCEKFGTPPPDAGGLPPIDPSATTRERFAMHTAKQSCRACHQFIDGVGFGFEHFDAIGAYRDTDNGQAIDAAGDMNDVEGFGTHTSAPFASLPELARILADSGRAKSCFTKQWYRFARGNLETEEDSCALRELETKFATSGWDIRELLIAVTSAPGFVERRAP